MKKRFLSILLALCMVLTLFPVYALAEESDFVIENGILTKYNGPGGAVTIPDNVTTIGAGAFNGCAALTSVTIPGNVTTIGNNAFCNCSNLVTATIPDSVNSIGVAAFQKCTSLTSIVIPNGVTQVANWTFEDCKNMTSVVIPASVLSLGQNSFCLSGLTNIDYTGTKEQWNNLMFASPNAKIPDNVTIRCADDGTAGAYWEYNETTKVLRIWGTGAMVDYTSLSQPWRAYKSDIVAQGSKYQYWIGLSYVNGSMKWVTDEPFSYANWDYREPDHSYRADGQREDYIHMLNVPIPGREGLSKRFAWNDMFVDNTFPGQENYFSLQNAGFICEYEPDANIVDQGTFGLDGNNLTWKLDESGTLTISGKGWMEDFLSYFLEPDNPEDNPNDLNHTPWSEYNDQVKSIVIENGVLNVGAEAFSCCNNVNLIELGENVCQLGNSALRVNYGNIYIYCEIVCNGNCPDLIFSNAFPKYVDIYYFENTSGWESFFKKVTDDDSNNAMALIPLTGKKEKMQQTLIVITTTFYDDDRTAYDYAGDFQKMLESAELVS